MKKSTFLALVSTVLLAAGPVTANAQNQSDNNGTASGNSTTAGTGNTNSTSGYNNSTSGSGMSNSTTNNQGQLSSRDFKFAKEAALGSKIEIMLGEAATKNAQDQAVKDFGAKMVQDHQQASQQLAQVLSQKGASVSVEPGWIEGKMLNHIEEMKGADFDRAYMKRMVSDHKEDVKLFQKETEDGDDADVKNFASKTLPTLQEHLRMAQDTQAKLTSSASR